MPIISCHLINLKLKKNKLTSNLKIYIFFYFPKSEAIHTHTNTHLKIKAKIQTTCKFLVLIYQNSSIISVFATFQSLYDGNNTSCKSEEVGFNLIHWSNPKSVSRVMLVIQEQMLVCRMRNFLLYEKHFALFYLLAIFVHM